MVTSHPASKKSAIFVIGTKYPICGLPVVAVPQYNLRSRCCKISSIFCSPKNSWRFLVIRADFSSIVLFNNFLSKEPKNFNILAHFVQPESSPNEGGDERAANDLPYKPEQHFRREHNQPMLRKEISTLCHLSLLLLYDNQAKHSQELK
eukprot:Pompholyxophrys_punicea_v1_NODE_469_length_1889_cov_3.664122.p2 type:complete len:149 gc:universal NODE_469_length_1889_cov_3.664122:1808-1362(-)